MLRIVLLLSTVLLIACGSNKSGAGPCAGDSPAEQCGASCQLDEECGIGFHCGSTGCTAQCTAGGDECPAEASCSDTGRCVVTSDGGLSDATACLSINLAVEEIIPTVILLIDQSGSMSSGFGGASTRWAAITNALVNSQNGIVKLLENKVNFGATLYTGAFSGTDGCPSLIVEAPMLSNYDSINSLLTSNSPDAMTPTGEAILATVASFPPPNSERPEPRILVLATDGDPNLCGGGSADDARALSENAVKDASKLSNIKTFVLSVGEGASVDHLNRVARLGAGQHPENGTALATIANNQTQLTDAFNAIIRSSRSCSFILEGAVAEEDAPTGTVTVTTPANGSVLLSFGSDWLIEGDELILLGEACEFIRSQDDVDINAEFPCGTIID